MTADATNVLQKRYSNPAKPARLGLLVIAVFILVMIGWGAMAPLSGAVIAGGALQVEGGRQAVQHPYGGVVAELLVSDGDVVEQGEVLMRLSDTEPQARIDVLQAERNALLASMGRLIAERDGLSEPAFPEELLARRDESSAEDAMASETALLAARREQFRTARAAARQEAAQLEERIAAATAQISALEEQRTSLASELESAQALLAEQLIAQSRVAELERQLSSLDSQIAVQQTEISAARKATEQARLEIENLERTRAAEVSAALQETRAALSELEPQITAARDALERTDIVAPVSGQVVDQTINTEGGVIAAGQPLLDIVPLTGPLIVEARMRLEDVNAVEAGTQADVRLLAFPATSRPDLGGTVETVSADRIVDDRTGQSYYVLNVALDPQQVADLGLDLQPGMPVQVVIPTKSRTLIDYLVSPLLDELNGAFRES